MNRQDAENAKLKMSMIWQLKYQGRDSALILADGHYRPTQRQATERTWLLPCSIRSAGQGRRSAASLPYENNADLRQFSGLQPVFSLKQPKLACKPLKIEAQPCKIGASSSRTIASSSRTIASSSRTIASPSRTIASSSRTIASSSRTIASSSRTIASSCIKRASKRQFCPKTGQSS